MTHDPGCDYRPFVGGGVTVWEGEPEVAYDYPMHPGDMCFLDNYVWHQGNPITAGERWSLVIFYATKHAPGNRLLSIVKVYTPPYSRLPCRTRTPGVPDTG